MSQIKIWIKLCLSKESLSHLYSLKTKISRSDIVRFSVLGFNFELQAPVVWAKQPICTPDMRQSKKLLTIDEHGLKSLERMFSIAICRQLGDKWQLKTLFLEMFDVLCSIVLTFSIAANPVCFWFRDFIIYNGFPGLIWSMMCKACHCFVSFGLNMLKVTFNISSVTPYRYGPLCFWAGFALPVFFFVEVHNSKITSTKWIVTRFIQKRFRLKSIDFCELYPSAWYVTSKREI